MKKMYKIFVPTPESHIVLTKGLQQGFAGKTNITKVERGGFQLKLSHVEDSGDVYHDEWINGGGQELVRTSDGEVITRTYVGNVVNSEQLEALGLSEKDVMTFLIRVITEYGDKTRFDSDFDVKLDEWKYSYKVTFRSDDPFIINGIEEIHYKGTLVFIHTFGISKATEA